MLRDDKRAIFSAAAHAQRAAEILHAAHAATGVAHRVLTPSRCAVTVRDDVRVLDFGVAELELGRLEEAGYRAPEQQQGGGDARSDVYTLAVILFELISGQNLAGKPPPRLRSLVAVPRPVDEFMAKALSQDPAQRFDLLTMRAALRELLGVAAVELVANGNLRVFFTDRHAASVVVKRREGLEPSTSWMATTRSASELLPRKRPVAVTAGAALLALT